MKKVLLVLAICAAPFLFSSCEFEDDSGILGSFIGNMKVTVDGVQHNFDGVAYYEESEYSGIACTKMDSTHESVAIVLRGKGVGEYTLGFAKSMNPLDLINANFSNIDEMSTVAYMPSSDAYADSYITVAGTCNITSVTDSKVVGNFTGYAVKVSDLQSISLSILQNAKTISGTFSATNGNSLADIFSK